MAATLRLTDPGPKEIALGTTARARVLTGIDLVADAVAATLGPRGRTVLIERANATAEISRDGYTVVRAIELGDRAADMGARIVREVAYQTDDSAGDGTTTAVILTGAMVRDGLRATAAGLAPLAVKRGIDRATAAALAGLERRARPLRSTAEIAHIGTISANGDRHVGELLARALDTIGQEGFVLVEEGTGREVELELRDGMHVASGYLSSHFVTDAKRCVIEMEEPYLLLHDGKITNFDAIEPVLHAFAKSDKWLLVMAEDVVGEALATLVINRRDAGLRVAAVKAPGLGPRRKAMLEDIAILTGGQVISEELGFKLEDVKVEQLGRAKKVTIDKDNTTLVEGAGKSSAIEGRVKQLRGQVEETTSDYDREKLQERLAKLVGGVAVIKVGAATETEMKEKKARVEDAMHATRAAVEEGIVPGGGVALLRAARSLDKLKLKGDEAIGVAIVKRALEEPARQIAQNAGFEGAIVVEKVRESTEDNFGFNAETEIYQNLVKAGVIDPTKVTRLALQHAASIAALMLTTEALIAEIPDESEKTPAMPPGGMGGGMY